ncbi:DUF6247 family protein [Saccharothrix variisporea]|uniref:DUF6247 family protein n=1 Tax=Saccharothrix variisporea TaxID=543527 RepID=UPI001B8604A2|nr:DUF6247 family protein [Saccharothrix variisporea]
MASPVERAPEPHRSTVSGADVDRLEPTPEWVGDEVAAERFPSPEDIRAALLPEEAPDFDAAYEAALVAARKTLHLDELRHVLRAWRRVALMTEQDPDAHRRTLATIAEVQRTGRSRPGSVSWNDLKAELGL